MSEVLYTRNKPRADHIARVLRAASSLESELRLSLRRAKATPITLRHPLLMNYHAVRSAGSCPLGLAQPR